MMMDRYDGPDVEGELAGRVAGHGMTAVMVAEGAMAGLATRGEKTAASHAETARQAGEQAAQAHEAARSADRSRWTAAASDPTALADWDGEQLGAAWAAAVRWPDEKAADRARVAVEAELREREPQVFARYAGLRACGHDPGEAMRRTLIDHHRDMAQEMAPLLGGPAQVAALDDPSLWQAWTAAEACGTTQAAPARAAAEAEAARRGGHAWAEYQSLLGSGDAGHAYGSAVADAAAEAGYPFHPAHLRTPSWIAVAAEGVTPAASATPTIPVAPIPWAAGPQSTPGQSVVVRAAVTAGRGALR